MIICMHYIESYTIPSLTPSPLPHQLLQPSHELAGQAVDRFVAAHSVLEIAWEPVYPSAGGS